MRDECPSSLDPSLSICSIVCLLIGMDPMCRSCNNLSRRHIRTTNCWVDYDDEFWNLIGQTDALLIFHLTLICRGTALLKIVLKWPVSIFQSGPLSWPLKEISCREMREYSWSQKDPNYCFFSVDTSSWTLIHQYSVLRPFLAWLSPYRSRPTNEWKM